jgi:hypothetical protein
MSASAGYSRDEMRSGRMDLLLPFAVLDGRDLGDLSSCGVDEFGIGIRMTCESPATLDRLCEQDPCPLFQRGSLAA